MDIDLAKITESVSNAIARARREGEIEGFNRAWSIAHSWHASEMVMLKLNEELKRLRDD
jgi:hypothetical protein